MVRYARGEISQAVAHSQNKPREKAGGSYAAGLFLQLPARGVRFCCDPGIVCRRKRRSAAVHLAARIA